MSTPSQPFAFETGVFKTEHQVATSLMRDTEGDDQPFIHFGNWSKKPNASTGFETSSSDYLDEDAKMQL